MYALFVRREVLILKFATLPLLSQRRIWGAVGHGRDRSWSRVRQAAFQAEDAAVGACGRGGGRVGAGAYRTFTCGYELRIQMPGPRARRNPSITPNANQLPVQHHILWICAFLTPICSRHQIAWATVLPAMIRSWGSLSPPKSDSRWICFPYLTTLPRNALDLAALMADRK